MFTFSPHFSYFLLNARFSANCPRLHGELISDLFYARKMEKRSWLSRGKITVGADLQRVAVYHPVYHH
jgi:hypothetical protein